MTLNATAPRVPSACFSLYSHKFLCLLFHQAFDFLDILVRSLLQLLLHLLDFVLGNLCLPQFLQVIIAVAANIADCYLTLFGLLPDLLGQILSALLRKLRKYQPYDTAVIGRIDT